MQLSIHLLPILLSILVHSGVLLFGILLVAFAALLTVVSPLWQCIQPFCVTNAPTISYSTSSENLRHIEYRAIQAFTATHAHIRVEIIRDQLQNRVLASTLSNVDATMGVHIIKFSTHTGTPSRKIIIIHGANSGPVMFFNLVPTLIQTGVEVYCIATPGFGEADFHPTLHSLTPDTIASVLDTYIHDIVVKYCNRYVSVFGHSFGGYIAGRFAAKHPAMVDKLVLMNAAGIFPTLDALGMYWGLLFKTGFPNSYTRHLGGVLNPILFSFANTTSDRYFTSLWEMAQMTCVSNFGHVIVSKFITYQFANAYWNTPMVADLLPYAPRPDRFVMIWGHDDNISPLHSAMMFSVLHKAVHGAELVKLFVVKDGWHNPIHVNGGRNIAYVLQSVFGSGSETDVSGGLVLPIPQIDISHCIRKSPGLSTCSLEQTMVNIKHLYRTLTAHFDIHEYSVTLKVTEPDTHTDVHIQDVFVVRL